MKNIHILPTDKPSRLISSSKEFNLFNKEVIDKRCKNLYITSDEEIKEGDYAYHKTFGVGKIININGEDCFVTIKLNPKDGSITTPWKRNIPDIKKIILTTDQDLIKDGIQAIDDEFLEWFVKNTSCEYVTVYDGLFGEDRIWKKYIIIPKEEPKQCCDSGIVDDFCINTLKCNNTVEKSKQETLEEAAEKFRSNNPGTVQGGNNTKILNAFKNGAKWQQERMYSEEEVVNILIKAYEDIGKRKIPNQVVLASWFEQFKKK